MPNGSQTRVGLFRIAATTVLVAAACKPATPPRVPTALLLSLSSVQLDAVGASALVTATVNDQDGKPMTNVSITWTSSAPTVATVTGTASASITAVSNGGSTLTAAAGNARATVGVNVAQVPVAPQKLAGDAQSGTVGAVLTTQLRLRVADRLGVPIAGQAVSFSAAAGNGSVSPAEATSGADGTATATWTLGTVPGTQTVNATAGAGGTASFTATAVAGPPAAIAVTAGNNQSAIAGSAVPTAPSVRIADAFNNPVAGATVTFAIVTGGGSLTGASATTNASGIATLGGWTLGTTAGTKTMTATVVGVAPVTFSATATAGPPTAMTVSAGNAQTATAGTAVAVAPSVRIDDVNGNPVAGVVVTFAVASGGGSATGTSAVTNVNGVAAVGSWTLGAAAGANTLTATAAPTGITGNPATFTATGSAGGGGGGGGGPDAFGIELRYLSTGSAAQIAAFTAAVTRWTSIITAGLPNTALTASAGSCGTGSPAISEVIDDLVILVSFAAIDGVGGILASAGPCFIRTTNGLPILGTMRFDTADLVNMEANGSLNSVILHEMGHVLGIGSLWSVPGFFSLLDTPSLPSSPGVDTRFTGTNGIAGFNSIGGTTYTGGAKVPVENTQGGTGTRDSHWRESVLVNELMTGFINAAPNPLSVLTIRSLVDLGYSVSTTPADAFFLTLTANARVETGPLMELRDDVLRIPISVVDEVGRVIRVIRPPPF